MEHGTWLSLRWHTICQSWKIFAWNWAYRVRLFLTDAEYRNIRRWAAADKVRILHHANVINGYLVDDKKRRKTKHPTKSKEENDL